MRYSYDYKKTAVELYRQGKWPDTPEGVKECSFHADLLLAGISQLLTVVVADKINQRQHLRSLKSFIA